MAGHSEQHFKEHLTQLALATGLENNVGLFPTDSEYRRLSITPSTFFGAARALMLQIAHPTVAQGIFDHSDFDTNPSKRAFRTFLGVFAIALGSQQFAIDIGAIVFKAHIPINGVIPAYKPDMSDRKYSAMEPEANLWVWATLVEGIMFGHKEVKYEVSRERLEKMYEEAKLFGAFFNVKEKLVPKTLSDFELYFDDVVQNKLEVTPAGKEVADALLSGARFPYTLFSWLFRSLSVESLPANINQAFEWESTNTTRRVYGTLRTLAIIQNAITPEFLKPSPAIWYPAIRRTLFGPGTNKLKPLLKK